MVRFIVFHKGPQDVSQDAVELWPIEVVHEVVHVEPDWYK